MNTFIALVKREILDGINGYVRVPVILAGLTVGLIILSALGFGELIHIDGLEREGVESLGEALSLAQAKESEHLPAAITIAYWGMSMLSWIALPFVVFFSLLGSLYEERRDRSILFWKSMPVSDWQEVLAKGVTSVFVAPAIFLGVAIVAQLAIAVVLSLLVLVQGGPVSELWPVGLMVAGWFTTIANYGMYALWALPVFAWLLLVSAYANRMPFMWAILPPVVLMIIEEMVFDVGIVRNWFGLHLGGWQAEAYQNLAVDIEGPKDLLALLIGRAQWDGFVYTFSSGQFWLGLVITGAFLFGAVEMRKRAI